MNKFLLRFSSETEMLEALEFAGAAEATGDPERPLRVIPNSAVGTIIVRGVLGSPGQYEDSGETDEQGGLIWTELVAPVEWPGYHCELVAEEVAEDLEMYVVEN